MNVIFTLIGQFLRSTTDVYGPRERRLIMIRRSNPSSYMLLIVIITITLLFVANTPTSAATVGTDAAPSPTQVLTSTPTPAPHTVPTATPSLVPTPTNTSVLTTLPMSTPMPMTQTPTLYDDFTGPILDENKWTLPTNKNLIYQAEGFLNLTNNQPAEETVSERLRAIGANRPMRELSFIINLKSYQGSIPGAAGLAICLADGKRLRVDVGPGPNNGTGIEIVIQ
jgi:hypothetical protein